MGPFSRSSITVGIKGMLQHELIYPVQLISEGQIEVDRMVPIRINHADGRSLYGYIIDISTSKLYIFLLSILASDCQLQLSKEDSRAESIIHTLST